MATDVVRRFRAGQIGERAARERLATLVCRAEIHRAVAFDHGTRHLSFAFREELAAENLMLLSRLMLGGAPNGYDLTYDGSLCGWARNLLYASRSRKIRDLAAKDFNQLGELRADQQLEIAVHQQADFYAHWRSNWSAESDASAAEMTEAAVRAIRIRRRQSERVEEGASMLAAKFGLTRPQRPLLFGDREQALALIGEHPAAAHQSVAAWVDRQTGQGPRHPTGHAGAVLLDLWSNQTLASAQRLLDLSHASVEVLVRAACHRRPRPSQRSITRLRGRIGRLAVTEQVRWGRIADPLVEAWVSSEYEATSSYAPTKAADLAAQESRHGSFAGLLEEMLDRASRHPQAPLGSAPRVILANLRAEASLALGA